MSHQLNTEHFKKLLLKEKARLEKDLSALGRVNPDNPQDWEATPSDEIDEKSPDLNKVADAVEDFEARTATLKELESYLQEVNHALAKIEAGTYGICEVSGKPIEEDRLEAYPAARTNKENINS